MAGPPVTLGCAVVLSPGAAGPPDSGFITTIPQAIATVNGMPLATATSICQMVNSVTGIPYPLPIPPGPTPSPSINGLPLVYMGDQIPAGPSVLTIVGPPAAPFITAG